MQVPSMFVEFNGKKYKLRCQSVDCSWESPWINPIQKREQAMKHQELYHGEFPYIDNGDLFHA